MKVVSFTAEVKVASSVKCGMNWSNSHHHYGGRHCTEHQSSERYGILPISAFFKDKGQQFCYNLVSVTVEAKKPAKRPLDFVCFAFQHGGDQWREMAPVARLPADENGAVTDDKEQGTVFFDSLDSEQVKARCGNQILEAAAFDGQWSEHLGPVGKVRMSVGLNTLAPCGNRCLWSTLGEDQDDSLHTVIVFDNDGRSEGRNNDTQPLELLIAVKQEFPPISVYVHYYTKKTEVPQS